MILAFLMTYRPWHFKYQNHILYIQKKNKIWMLLRNWIPPFSQIYQILESFFLAIGLYIYHYNIIKKQLEKTNFKNKTKQKKQKWISRNKFYLNGACRIRLFYLCNYYCLLKTKQTIPWTARNFVCSQKSLKRKSILGFWKIVSLFCFLHNFKCFLKKNPEWTSLKNLYQSLIT